MPSDAILFSNIAFSLFGVAVFLSLVLWQSKKIWSGRNNWYATQSYPNIKPENDPQRAINKNRHDYWRSYQPQEENASFEVDMCKPRTIASIKFLTDDSDMEKPKKWRMMFYKEDQNGLKHALCHKDGEYEIFVKGSDISNPIQWFEIKIREVAEDMKEDTNYAKQHGTKVFWTISLIRLTEYRFNILGKRFCKHEL